MIEGQQLTGGSCTPDAFNANPHYTRRVIDLFYAEDDDPQRQAEAKAICETCPVRSECLEIGMSERFGIWGGVTSTDRRKMRKIVRHR